MRYIEPLPTCIPSMFKVYKRVKRIDPVISRIVKIIEAETSINILDNTTYRGRKRCETRQMFLTLLTIHTKWTLKSIGAIVGKDHSTVIHAMKTVQNMRDTDTDFKELFDRINKQVKEFCKYNQ